MTLKRVLLVDLETSSLDPAEGQILEAAGVLFDVQHAEVIEARSLVVHAPSNAAEAINGLSTAFLRSLPTSINRLDGSVVDEQPAVELLYAMAKGADAFVAHRATFEMRWLPPGFVRLAPWICSKFACDWPRGRYGSHLTHLAIDHGVPVTGAHRALDDCMLLVRVMQAAHEHWAAHHQTSAGRQWDVRALPEILEAGLARGVGDPPRCRHGLEDARQCQNYVRTYLRTPTLDRCLQHGGSSQWVS